jgi:hypothetical protein
MFECQKHRPCLSHVSAYQQGNKIHYGALHFFILSATQDGEAPWRRVSVRNISKSHLILL